jgi:hypothetical protein
VASPLQVAIKPKKKKKRKRKKQQQQKIGELEQ